MRSLTKNEKTATGDKRRSRQLLIKLIVEHPHFWRPKSFGPWIAFVDGTLAEHRLQAAANPILQKSILPVIFPARNPPFGWCGT